ncbi:LEAF RUST 10 DISEASE-RESISTANCE LOCUS RECEPTOR-LIKE PROTEIN KINASE-like 2.4 isoform X2 [Cucumis sativus]|uniref:LEAF RUST 10 DISEASE-RESISTANCE LOCUS RECEPTOR-LIKE PROTEIN KINASE-like 2.4 isoform X2 n=1 Tax=Cucumis sativus TaxID=3659 RepID=UPI0012F4C3F4|nr:LEAF RUST 10 DISEASE-RESISTANCE LOCUS RECEPTOR-LIKE PROTEIN KINASE-like 2.4 isoform X2 [Cucumis sativus]
MKPSLPQFLFFTILWFDFHLCFSNDANEEFKACSVYYSCGVLVNISYPFWGNERQQFCGRREFELNCKDNKTTTIQINSVEYNVVNINQTDHSMTIARSDLLDDYCPKIQIKTATLGHNLFKYSSNDLNLSLWYDCPVLEGIRREMTFECGSSEGERRGRVNYALEKKDAMNWRRNMSECRVKMEVTITKEVLTEGEKNRTMVVERGMKEGFEVEYGDLYTIACEGCKEQGGACGGNTSKEFRCVCGNGNVHPYICKSSSSSSPPPPPPAAPYLDVIWLDTKTGGTSSGGFVLVISIIIFIYWKRKRTSNKDKIEKIIRRYSIQTPKRYSYSKLKKITDCFNNKLGQGGFSTVYKGKLPNGCDVAVKLLNESRQENGQDFINEVVSIAKTSHINIVTLIGFCYEQNKRALIYEYMPKGSLDKYIYHNRLQENDMKLDWNTLYNIVIGVARGLEYLHRGCNTRILHFDIKPHNILLDSDFCPKISDFGLAKQCEARESHVSMTGVKGTIGFIAPEVIFRNSGKVSHKSDVYSYGMLILEMVGARKKPNEGVEQKSEAYFPDWIYKDLTQSEIDGGCWWGNTKEEEEMARKMIIVGLHCIQTLPDDRPSMTNVVVMLEGSVDVLQIPPKPNMYGPPNIEQPQASFSSLSNKIPSISLIHSSREATQQ